MNKLQIILTATLCCTASITQAATLTVDCDAGQTIMAALPKTKPGDTVLVSGSCNEHVNIAPEYVNITLDGQKKTTIKHPGGNALSPHAVYVRGKEITVKGFTITGGLDGLHLSGPASGVADSNLVTGNKGRGIHIDKGSVIRLLNNTVENSGSIGIDITGASYAYIGVYIPRVPALSPNIVRNNGGPGINIERTAGAWIVGNTITGNKESGIVVHRNAQADVIANVISGNGGDGITASFGSGINFDSEPRKDGPNKSDKPNAGAALRCFGGGYVDGPMGNLSGAKGGKVIDSGCVDRVQ